MPIRNQDGSIMVCFFVTAFSHQFMKLRAGKGYNIYGFVVQGCRVTHHKSQNLG